MSLAEVLATDLVGKVVARQREGEGLVFAIRGEELGTVALRMAKKRISALPVFSDPSKETCIGLVDFADIVSILLDKFEHDSDTFKDKDTFWESLKKIPVEQAIDASGKNSMNEIHEDAPLRLATQMFAQLAIKRLVVVDGARKVVGLLSPSALTSHAVTRLRGIVDPNLNHTVEKLNMGSSPVIFIPKTKSFLEALRLMKVSKHSCLAVIDDQTSMLSGSVSMSDIKMLFYAEDFSILAMSSWDLIVLSRSLQDTEQFPYFGVSMESKVLAVISKLLATHVHHIYVVDKAQKPKRIIGFSDVCKALATST